MTSLHVYTQNETDYALLPPLPLGKRITLTNEMYKHTIYFNWGSLLVGQSNLNVSKKEKLNIPP